MNSIINIIDADNDNNGENHDRQDQFDSTGDRARKLPDPAPSKSDPCESEDDLDKEFPLVEGPPPEPKRRLKYPFDKLNVGEGRRIGEFSQKLMQRLYSAVYSYEEKHYGKFKATRQDGFIVLWRTK